ncbi:MAG TPA: glycosyltransferase family 4 protein [Pseudolabrys sp.]|nr:glycosyltransferase family 4 protein [Pseudolabrys sp.]
MRFAFAIVSLFPGGGLQRDCIDIARRVRKSGHDVTIFTSRISDTEFIRDLNVRILHVGPTTNHKRQRLFSNEFHKVAAGHFDLLVGFDKLAGLDILYCSDRSMYARTAVSPLMRALPRYSEFIRLEKECFAPNQPTKILLLSESQLNEYWTYWQTEPKRLTLLPPTLAAKRRKFEYRTDGTRRKWRTQLGLSDDDWVWISVAVQPRTKGIDRTVRALNHFRNARLLVVGLDEGDDRALEVARLAQILGVSERIKWLGHREEIPELLAAADLFVHPARYDTTGTVLLEAIVNGLPVITTSACGYAKHVSGADAGIVIQEPFHQRTFLAALETARDRDSSEHWSKSGTEYGKQKSLYEGKTRAAVLLIARGLEGPQAVGLNGWGAKKPSI